MKGRMKRALQDRKETKPPQPNGCSTKGTALPATRSAGQAWPESCNLPQVLHLRRKGEPGQKPEGKSAD